MPKVTLWVSDADFHVVKKAKKDLEESLSALFIHCLRARFAAKPPARKTKTRPKSGGMK
jgi:hypothetical protein